MYEMDYDVAASYWTEKYKTSAHLDEETLRKKIDGFLKEHNTCALATASADMVRNTPIEYNYLDGVIYLFSEGGLKFKALPYLNPTKILETLKAFRSRGQP